MIDEKNFGERLIKSMENAGYTNIQLTQKLELSKNAIGNYKNNQIPNATILYRISQELGTTMEYLLTGKNVNDLTSEEAKIVKAYKNASPAIQEATRKLLDIEQEDKENRGKSSESAVG